MKNYAWVNLANNTVENIIYYDGVTPIELPQGIILVEYSEGIQGSWSSLSPGWKYINDEFVEPEQPPQPEPTQPTTTGSQTL